MDYIIITFPRCGSNYLVQLIKQKLRDPNNPTKVIDIPKSHKIEDGSGKKVITIIRNPYETLKSYVTLVMSLQHTNKFYLKPDETFRFPAKEYIAFYEYIYENADIIIDYDDLVNRPNDVINYLANHMSLAVKNVEYINELTDADDHLVSSKSSPLYETLQFDKYFPGNFKLFEAKDHYLKVLGRAIRI